jgi:hypothetical protein
MKIIAIREFASSRGITQIIPTVRTNVNGYPYLTMINGKNEAENVYFSKNAATMVVAGSVLSKEELKSLNFATTTNAAGDERTKIVSATERVDIDSLFA